MSETGHLGGAAPGLLPAVWELPSRRQAGKGYLQTLLVYVCVSLKAVREQYSNY